MNKMDKYVKLTVEEARLMYKLGCKVYITRAGADPEHSEDDAMVEMATGEGRTFESVEYQYMNEYTKRHHDSCTDGRGCVGIDLEFYADSSTTNIDIVKSMLKVEVGKVKKLEESLKKKLDGSNLQGYLGLFDKFSRKRSGKQHSKEDDKIEMRQCLVAGDGKKVALAGDNIYIEFQDEDHGKVSGAYFIAGINIIERKLTIHKLVSDKEEADVEIGLADIERFDVL